MPYLVTIIIITGAIFIYLYYIGPKLNPLNRAQNYISQNMITEAIIEYKKLIAKNPKDVMAHYRLGNLYFELDEIDKGVLHFEEIIDIDEFTIDVDKYEIWKKLGQSYIKTGYTERAFQMFMNIVLYYPSDTEALYHVSFIALGQEMFEFANKHFELLLKTDNNSFEVFFGAGMAAYQNQKIGSAVECFKKALAIDRYSDIANLAIAFSFKKKSDYKAGFNFLDFIIDNSKDLNAIFIARRLKAFLLIHTKKPNKAISVFEELLSYAKDNDLHDEISLILYDFGFTALKAENTDMAYKCWNEVYENDKIFKNIGELTIILRKQMDKPINEKVDIDALNILEEHTNMWIKTSFPENYLWRICGLKSNIDLDIEKIAIQRKHRDKKSVVLKRSKDVDYSKNLKEFTTIDVESFRSISVQLVEKLGYNIDEILTTYRENDGVDFMATLIEEKIKTLIWIRRWSGTLIGEIPLRNFAQEINDSQCQHGLFITATELTPPAESSLGNLSKVEVIYPDDLGEFLSSL